MLNSLTPWYMDIAMKGFSTKQRVKAQNANEFWIIYNKLLNLSINQFEYEGAPDTFDPWFFEFALIVGGMGCIARDKTYGVVGLRAAYGGLLNVTGYPIEVWGYGVNGYNHKYTNYIEGADNSNADAVAIFDDCLRSNNTGQLLYTYSWKIADCLRSIDVAMKKLKNPYYIVAPQEMVASIEKILNDIDNNKESVISSNSLRPEEFKVVPTAQDGTVLAQLWQCYNKLYDLVKEYLGIKNINSTEKMERLVTNEAESPDMPTCVMLDNRLKARQRGLEKVNKLLGTNITVRLRDPFEAFYNSVTDYEEDDEDGNMDEVERPDTGTDTESD